MMIEYSDVAEGILEAKKDGEHLVYLVERYDQATDSNRWTTVRRDIDIETGTMDIGDYMTIGDAMDAIETEYVD